MYTWSQPGPDQLTTGWTRRDDLCRLGWVQLPPARNPGNHAISQLAEVWVDVAQARTHLSGQTTVTASDIAPLFAFGKEKPQDH